MTNKASSPSLLDYFSILLSCHLVSGKKEQRIIIIIYKFVILASLVLSCQIHLLIPRKTTLLSLSSPVFHQGNTLWKSISCRFIEECLGLIASGLSCLLVWVCLIVLLQRSHYCPFPYSTLLTGINSEYLWPHHVILASVI